MIGEDTRRAVARDRSEIGLWVLLNKCTTQLAKLSFNHSHGSTHSWRFSTFYKISRGPATLFTTSVWDVLCHILRSRYQEQKQKWWDNVIFTIHVLSRLKALLTWAASLGWTSTSAVTCCNIYREYHAPVDFTLSYVHRFCSSHHSNCLSYIWRVTRSNSRIILMAFFAKFCFILLNM